MNTAPPPVSNLLKNALILLSVVLYTAAMPGSGGLWPLLFVALIPFLCVIYRSRTAVQAARAGFLFGFVSQIAMMYWIYTVLSVYGGLPWYVAVAGLCLLCVYGGLYLALFAFCAHKVFKLPSMQQLCAVPILWVAQEYLKGMLFTGLPWMDIGYGLYSQPLLLQAADLFGHLFLSFCILLINTLFVLLWVTTGCSRRQKMSVVVTVVCVMAGVTTYSVLRYGQIDTALLEADRAKIGVVQGNIKQNLKWDEAHKRSTIDSYIRLSHALYEKGTPDFLVWPETALPFYPVQDELFGDVLAYLRSDKATLLTGAPWYDYTSDGHVRYYNSAVLVGFDATLLGKYYKNHLVPFGEYVPLATLFRFAQPLVESAGNFTAGTIGKPLPAKNMYCGVLICFESVFADISRKWVKQGANILINITNDAWYGKSSAPYHSFAMTVVRAVEARRGVVRAANTGISGYIDPLGRVGVKSPLFEEWSAQVEPHLVTIESFYVRYGHFFGPVSFLLATALVLFMFMRERKSPSRLS
jgi:apolipoprotein N-acyltransferase